MFLLHGSCNMYDIWSINCLFLIQYFEFTVYCISSPACTVFSQIYLYWLSRYKYPYVATFFTVLQAPPEVMEGILELIDVKYGGLDKYLDEIGFNDIWRDKLRLALRDDWGLPSSIYCWTFWCRILGCLLVSRASLITEFRGKYFLL